jgi:hypothetical protein
MDAAFIGTWPRKTSHMKAPPSTEFLCLSFILHHFPLPHAPPPSSKSLRGELEVASLTAEVARLKD